MWETARDHTTIKVFTVRVPSGDNSSVMLGRHRLVRHNIGREDSGGPLHNVGFIKRGCGHSEYPSELHPAQYCSTGGPHKLPGVIG